jgi:hypothetical protein
MHITAILLAALCAAAPQIEPAHARNDVFSYVLEQGFEVEGKRTTLPRPRFYDGQEAAAQKAILVELAESEEQLNEMVDDSLRAPNVFRKDEIQPKTDSAVVRVVDLWFVVYADLSEFDAASQANRVDGKKIESGDIKYECRLLKEPAIRAAGITLGPQASGQNTWFTQVLGELPNKVSFDVTERAVVTQTRESVVIATRIDPAFAKAKHPSNIWRRAGNGEGAEGKELSGPYQGGISYAKVSRLAIRPRALIVEMHGAWVEPYEWYEGGGALSTKLKRGTDEGIKKLREELAENRAK